MDTSKILKDTENKFAQSLEHFQAEAAKLRTGRAHPSMLDGVMVEAYGVPTPLIQVASISIPEPALLQVTPFDPSNIAAVSAGIRARQELNFNPADDGRVVRVPVPPLTAERRQQIVKTLKEKTEDAFVSMRNSRHDALKAIKAGEFSTDEAKRLEKQIDDSMSATKRKIEEFAKTKETEILTI